MIVALNNNYWL